MSNSVDGLALWNLVTTVDSFLSAGFTPNALGAPQPGGQHGQVRGMGGTTSMQTMYHGNLLGREQS